MLGSYVWIRLHIRSYKCHLKSTTGPLYGGNKIEWSSTPDLILIFWCHLSEDKLCLFAGNSGRSAIAAYFANKNKLTTSLPVTVKAQPKVS